VEAQLANHLVRPVLFVLAILFANCGGFLTAANALWFNVFATVGGVGRAGFSQEPGNAAAGRVFTPYVRAQALANHKRGAPVDSRCKLRVVTAD